MEEVEGGGMEEVPSILEEGGSGIQEGFQEVSEEMMSPQGDKTGEAEHSEETPKQFPFKAFQ